ncbi:MAG: class II histone deacetylase [Leucobacter sp.]
MTTGYLWDERFIWWDQGHAAEFIPAGGWVEPGLEHAENASVKQRFANLVGISGLRQHLTPLTPRPATREELLRFHTPDYLDRMKALSDTTGGDAGESAPFMPGAFEIAQLAAGGVITAAEAVLAGEVDNAMAIVRPSGHHAEADRGRGNCMFGNAVIAIRHLQATRGVGRVAVVDWDVHHGNGTQSAFYEDPSVLTVSLHQDRYYPHDSGFVEEIGEGPGEGTALNIPLPPGTGPGGYLAAFEDVVMPALAAYRPEFIVNVMGFDSSALDPIGRQMLNSESYREMTRLLMQAADDTADGRLLCIHEGGYSPAYVPFCGLAVLEQLSGHRTEVVDPFYEALSNWAGLDLQPHQRTVIDAARANLSRLPTAE